MLVFLFGFIEQYIIQIFIVILALAIASSFSKHVKHFFVTILGLSALYFLLLCLYELGIGNEALYQFSCRYIYIACDLFERIFSVCIHTDMPSKMIQMFIAKDIQGILSVLYFSGLPLLIYGLSFVQTYFYLSIRNKMTQTTRFIKTILTNELLLSKNIFYFNLKLRL